MGVQAVANDVELVAAGVVSVAAGVESAAAVEAAAVAAVDILPVLSPLPCLARTTTRSTAYLGGRCLPGCTLRTAAACLLPARPPSLVGV